jgi:molybdate transport system permease protein
MRKALLALCYFLAAAAALAFLALPILAIFVHVPPGRLIDQLSNPVVTDALIVSFKTTLIAQAFILLFGTPTAYLLASRRFPGRSLCVTLVELPLVLPPAVAGIGLLAAFGRLGLLGSSLRSGDHDPVHADRSHDRCRVRRQPSLHPFGDRGLRGVDPNLVAASRTLGCRPRAHVLPSHSSPVPGWSCRGGGARVRAWAG